MSVRRGNFIYRHFQEVRVLVGPVRRVLGASMRMTLLDSSDRRLLIPIKEEPRVELFVVIFMEA